jgi:hypothetical protein
MRSGRLQCHKESSWILLDSTAHSELTEIFEFDISGAAVRNNVDFCGWHCTAETKISASQMHAQMGPATTAACADATDICLVSSHLPLRLELFGLSCPELEPESITVVDIV